MNELGFVNAVDGFGLKKRSLPVLSRWRASQRSVVMGIDEERHADEPMPRFDMYESERHGIFECVLRTGDFSAPDGKGLPRGSPAVERSSSKVYSSAPADIFCIPKPPGTLPPEP